MSLCHRCEHRAVFLEKGYGPRCECKDVGLSTPVCYMYKPVKPVILEPAYKADKRPRFAGALFCSRERFSRVADKEVELTAEVVNKRKKQVLLYWRVYEDT